MWFIEPARLDTLGPASGSGAVWLNEPVKAGEPSDPFLFSKYTHRLLHVRAYCGEDMVIEIQVDRRGDGQWKYLRKLAVPAHADPWLAFDPSDTGAWIRLKTNRDCIAVTASFHYRQADLRTTEAAPIFEGIPTPGDTKVNGGLIYARGAELKTLRFVASNPSGELGCYDLDGDLQLHRTEDADGIAWTKKNFAIPQNVLTVDDGSVLYVDAKGRWRLPKGDGAFDNPGPLGDERICREVCTERDLFNAAGTFFELPAENAGGFAKIHPITTHNRRIKDYASYRGLLVLSGVTDEAKGEHIIRSDDGKCALWVGAVDDLWQLGKPRGEGGPWMSTEVQPGKPSDPFLMAGYDRKRMTLSHDAKSAIEFTVEVDFLGTGAWSEYARFNVATDKPTQHEFPAAFDARWVRVKASQACRATAIFRYD